MTRYDAEKSDGIRLILDTDAIISPITGIGRYALELLRNFATSEEIIQLRCFDRGRWRSTDEILSSYRLEVTPAMPAVQRWHQNPFKATLRKLLPLAQRVMLRKYRDHIFHSPNYRLAPFPGRRIATFHDLSVLRFPEFHPTERVRVLAPALEYAAKNADHILTDSEMVRREVIEYFSLPPEQVTAVHLASSLSPGLVDAEARERYLSSLSVQAGHYLLFASTLEPRKNVAGLLRAYSGLPAQIRSRFPLVLAGQMGWQSEEISRELAAAQRRGNVIHTGFVSNLELASLYAGARALVYPSLYEGFGLPPLEAQCFGIPVITSNCSCLPEVMGDSAMLVDPGSTEAIRNAMLQLTQDEDTRRRLSEAGRANAARFSWKKTAAATIEVYRRLS